MRRHLCNNQNDGEWAHCNVCGGRIHLDGCTTKKRNGIDCAGQEYHTPAEMEAAGYGPAEEWQRYLDNRKDGAR